MFPKPIQQLIEQLSELPGVGPRQAARFAFFLMKDEQRLTSLQNSLRTLQNEIALCANCYLPHERNDQNLCAICLHPKRNASTICVVEKESDAMRVEKAGVYNGIYYILGGMLTPMRQDNNIKERVSGLRKKFEQRGVGGKELILALNPTREGMFTSLYIEEVLKKLPDYGNLRVTRLARGLATGSELEYVDEETLRNALEGRK
ncbi:MAG: recombination protein RecR [Candidatus Spechtbacteria bacterium]|nr:recombination protein RecR [Candidatus Spechtbacteria bacterium]